jgi:hypothetical protein
MKNYGGKRIRMGSKSGKTRLSRARHRRNQAAMKQGGEWSAWELSNEVTRSGRRKPMTRQWRTVADSEPKVVHGKNPIRRRRPGVERCMCHAWFGHVVCGRRTKKCVSCMRHAAGTLNFMRWSQPGAEYACGVQKMRERHQMIEGQANPALCRTRTRVNPRWLPYPGKHGGTG